MQLDYGRIADAAAQFICEQVDGAGALGVVFGLSGGIDSTVTAYLSQKALGKRCMALLMPNSDFTPDSETQDGRLVARLLRIQHRVIQLQNITEVIISHYGYPAVGGGQMRAIGNLNARMRTTMLYYEAQKNNYLVVGTGNKSEYMLGYFTKYGDGASDMLPIADLYKTEVQKLGKFLEVPQHIVDKEPSPHLWRGHRAVDELGADYSTVDDILKELECGQYDAGKITKKLGVDTNVTEHIIKLHQNSAHKRGMPPIAKLRGEDPASR